MKLYLPENDNDANPVYLPGGDLGNLILGRKIGEGATGLVYKAEMKSINKEEPVSYFAVKIMRKEYLFTCPEIGERFEIVPEICKFVNESRIIKIFEAEEFSITWEDIPSYSMRVRDPYGNFKEEMKLAVPFYIMEYIEGESLRDLLESEKPISKKQAISIVKETADILGVLHKKSVFHCDLKPGNIFIVDSRIKITDIEFCQSDKFCTAIPPHRGFLWGDAKYISPEQLLYHTKKNQISKYTPQIPVLPITNRSDIYSLGIILYELLTGQSPERKIIEGTVNLNPEMKPIDSGIDTIIKKATQIHPEERYESVEDLLKDLFHLENGR
ncbi:MAG: serine/threonine protein kinase [Candidatus Eremiobacteraeota bacterium]|nr:serine/threonine protein kinase [Candidatus Eremiobacteraeota bacterium]